MAQKKPLRLPALQASLFCDRDQRAMTWDRIPEPLRQGVVERLAQLLRESCEAVGKDERKSGSDDNGEGEGSDD